MRTMLHTVDGATAAAITAPNNADGTLERRYLEAAVAVAERGARALTTNCGFTLPYQHTLQQSTGLPVVSSALLLLPTLGDVYGSGVGVLTYDNDVLTTVLARSWDGRYIGVRCADVQRSGAWHALADVSGTSVDIEAMRDDLVAIADTFVRQNELTALLLECTGFAPFADALRTRLGLPVFDHIAIVRFLLGTPLPPADLLTQASNEGMHHE
jgi:Asp/Glu/hydantoin racemase